MSAIGPFDSAIPPSTLKQIAAVVPNLEVRDIRLVSLSGGLTAPPPPRSQTTVELDHQVEVEHANGANLFMIRVHFKIAATGTAEGSSEFMNLTAGFQLIYAIEDPQSVQEENLRAFGEINAVHTAWPYFREFVHNISGRMGLMPMTVPLLKVGRASSTKPTETQPAPQQ